jgi:hypothetical protein
MFNKTIITIALLIAVSSIAAEDSYYQATVTINDLYGSADVIAEQLQITDDVTFSDELFYLDKNPNGTSFLLKGDAVTNGGQVDGRMSARFFQPEGLMFKFDARAYDFLYDRTIETNHPMLLEPTPLDLTPTLRWSRWSLSAHGGSLFGGNLEFGYVNDRRKGSKAGYQGAAFSTVDGRRDSGTFWTAYDISRGNLDLSGKFILRNDDGWLINDYNTIDRTTWSGALGARYLLNDELSLFGNGIIANNNSRVAAAKATDLESNTKSGTVGIAYQKEALTTTVSAGVAIVESSGYSLTSANVTDLDRTKTTTKLNGTVRYTGIAKTRLSAKASFVKKDIDQTIELLDGLGGNVIESNVTSLEKTVTKVAFKASKKIGNVSAKASVNYSTEQADRVDEGDMFYYQPDRKRDAMKARFCGRAKLFGISTKAGGEIIRQSIDLGETDTTFDANRAFMTLSKMHGSWLALNAHVSYGQEQYGIGDVVELSDSMNAISYDTTTLRFAPGATMITDWATLNGQVEFIQNRDSVENDYTRWFCSATRQWADNLNIIASYKRYEFDENRWDDFIVDQYSLSLHVMF